jgi:putative addiction module component (TIGR02574 family)
MSPNFDLVYQAAMSLPADERAQLVDSLIATFSDEQGEPLDEAWLQEIERRSAEIDAGTAELVPWEEARRRANGLSSSLPLLTPSGELIGNDALSRDAPTSRSM